ncbi:MAG: hypothetical protein AVO38_11005 [delta proteobacterium ML8_D]|nr:MAG: hypothetical protein AVO34_05395 [Firmicutes bacterium ML8_F2]OPL15115.1 MAG: hypothetical protein AVO38_11005 [delta proteobacterium ML8_D]
MKTGQDINMSSLEALKGKPFLPDEHHMLNELIDRCIEIIGDGELTVNWICSLRNEDVRILFKLLQVEGMKTPKNTYYN